MRLALLPSHISARDAKGGEHAFTLAVRWDGGFQVQDGAAPTHWPGKGTIVAIAPERCLRRRLRLRPHSQGELRALAADLFPFDLADTPLALHQRADGLDVCVLADADKAALAGAAGAIIAEPGAEALAAALRHRLSHGEVFDFVPAPLRLISPAPVFAVANLGLLAASVTLALSLVFMGQSAQDRAIRAELLRLQEEAMPLAQRRQTTAAMVRGVEELARFAQRPSAALVPQLTTIVASVPTGTLIDKIGYKDQHLTLSGLGNEAEDWLHRNGVAEGEMQNSDLPKIDRFTVTRSLNDPVRAR